MYDVVVGRQERDREHLGLKGTVLLGKQYVRMGRVESLSNNVFLDVTGSHVVFVCGKRGGGKSYSLGVLAEGIASLPQEVRQNLAVVILDTMGIFWTMKHANKPDKALLKEWGMQPKAMDVSLFVPEGHVVAAKKAGIPVDHGFSVNPMELQGEEWRVALGILSDSPSAVLIDRVIADLKDAGKTYGLLAIESAIKKAGSGTAKDDVLNRLAAARRWGLFSDKATPLDEVAKPGTVSIVDLSPYNEAGGWMVKSLAVGLLAQKLFTQRMEQRQREEREAVESAERFGAPIGKTDYPMVWLMLDEAHEFLPREGSTLATDALVTILREGRQPGISLVLASQQPGKIHTDVLTQADTVVSHRITAKIDTDALGVLMQSYMREGLDVLLDRLPREQGAALVFDDMNERIFPIRVRPRMTWHGGSSASALR